VDVRVVATTNRDLESEVAAGRFREDLYFRLSQLVVDVPPLRERKEDISLLADYFLARAARAGGGPQKRLSSGALARLMSYSWPGNVRELENLLERAYLLADGPEIGPELLGVGMEQTAPLVGLDGADFVGRPVEEVERAHVLATLKHTNWHQKRAAELLGIGVRTLREKVKRWNLKKEK
jgi:Nif-specific regulatory protein